MKNKNVLIVFAILFHSFGLLFSSDKPKQLNVYAKTFIPTTLARYGTADKSMILAQLEIHKPIKYGDNQIFFREGVISCNAQGKTKVFSNADDCFQAVTAEIYLLEQIDENLATKHIELLIDRDIANINVPVFALLPPAVSASK